MVKCLGRWEKHDFKQGVGELGQVTNSSKLDGHNHQPINMNDEGMCVLYHILFLYQH